MADKFITLHPNNNGVLDNTTNIYPNIKASQNILNDEGTPIVVQEKLINGSNIKNIRVGSASATPESLLGSGSIVIDFLNMLYPVGTIYTCSTNATITKDASDNPICPIQQILGGVWAPIYDTFLYASAKGTHVEDTNDYFPGDSGGSKDAIVVQHTHGSGQTGQAGSHTHTVTGTINLLDTDSKSLEGHLWIRRVVGAQNNFPAFLHSDGICTYSEDADNTYVGQGVSDASPRLGTTNITIDATHRHTLDTTPAHRHEIASTGVSGIGKNMPPYMAIYAWERIS